MSMIQPSINCLLTFKLLVVSWVNVVSNKYCIKLLMWCLLRKGQKIEIKKHHHQSKTLMSVSLHITADLFELANWSQEWYSEWSEEAQACSFIFRDVKAIVGFSAGSWFLVIGFSFVFISSIYIHILFLPPIWLYFIFP